MSVVIPEDTSGAIACEMNENNVIDFVKGEL
jgi:hypothetical protein